MTLFRPFIAEMSLHLAAATRFNASERSFFQGVCSNAVERSAPDEVVADAWHFLQMNRFGEFLNGRERLALRQFQRHGTLDALRSPLGTRTIRETGLIDGLDRSLALEVHPELALSVYEFSVEGSLLREHTNRLFHIFSIFCSRIEAALGGAIPLVDVRTDEWEGSSGRMETFVTRLSARILSPRLFQRALERIYPEKGLSFDYRSVEYQGEDLRNLRRQNVLGTSLPWGPVLLKDVQSPVPGWFYRLHDDYHKSDQALLPEATRKSLDHFLDFIVWVRSSFSGTPAEMDLLETLQDVLDDREAAYLFDPAGALERLWSVVALHYLVLPVLEPYWMRDPVRNRRIIGNLLRRHYQKGLPLREILATYGPRCEPEHRAAYRRAVDFLLRKARRHPEPETSAMMTRFFEGLARPK